MVVVPNVTPDTPPLKKNPVFLYMNDGFQKPNPFSHDVVVGIDEVFEQKVRGLDAHRSQMYEWLPWVGGSLDRVPDGDEARFQYLLNSYTNRSRVSDEQRASLEKWYGKEKAATFQFVESFEICEYGHQPSDDELLAIFPMLNDN